MKCLFLFLIICSIGASGACLPVTGDRILGRDLALADTHFSGLPAALQLGYAPAPGVARVFAVAELRRIAHANGIAWADGPEVCFEVPMHVPSDTEFIESMQHSLPQSATLRLTDMGRSAIPAGKIEFPLSGLEPAALGSDGVQLWRGLVQYTNTRRITLWARVTVTVTYGAVITGRDLAINTPIDASALRLENRTGTLLHAPCAARIEDVAGHIVTQPLKAGAEMLLALLEEPPVVKRGDSVRVEVQSGRAILRFDAIAQSAARTGEIAELRNPITGKTFHARISAGPTATAASKAVVIVGKSPAL